MGCLNDQNQSERCKNFAGTTPDTGALFESAIEQSPLAMMQTDGENHIVRYANPDH